MSQKERRRLAVFAQVCGGQLTVAAAGRLLGISERQARRIWSRYQVQGDAGLVHRLRGRSGNRGRDPALRREVVNLYRDHYSDFGCTLACEYLAERHDLIVDDQTLRRWLRAEGLWHRRRRSPKKRRRRERRACFGELVQIDGSHHDWFEGRGPWAVLMVMIDDATGHVEARFFEGETTEAAMTIFRLWALKHGLPLELYPDQDSIYRVNTEQADEIERRTGKRPLTQFGRAMAELGVKLTCAKSPQAKGRVERKNGTLQDRLVKAMRVEGIRDIASANAYLERIFLPKHNGKFTVTPASEADVHRASDEAELEMALCRLEQRKVGQDHCIGWAGRTLQLRPDRKTPSLAGKKVAVRKRLDGQLTVHWRERVVDWKPVERRPRRTEPSPDLVQRVAKQSGPTKPAADHPWRRPACGGPKRNDSRVGPGSAPGSAPPRPPLHQDQPAA